MFFRYFNARKFCGAATGQALTETVPIIDASDAGRVDRNSDTDAAVAISHRNDNPVSVDGSRAIVFKTIEKNFSVFADQFGISGEIMSLGHRVAKNSAFCNFGKPARMRFRIRKIEALLQEGKVSAEKMGDVRISLG